MEVRERGAHILEALTILNRTASSVPNEDNNRLLPFFGTAAKDFSWKVTKQREARRSTQRAEYVYHCSK